MSLRPILAAALSAAALLLTACASGPGLSTASASDATFSTDPITADTATLTVQGLGCPLCAHNLDKQLLELDGVKEVKVDLGTGSVDVALAGSARPSPADFARAVDRSGFTLVRIQTR